MKQKVTKKRKSAVKRKAVKKPTVRRKRVTRKKSNIQPREKHKKVVKILTESNGNKSRGDILKEAGYGKTSQLNPSRVFETTGMQILLEQHLPDEKLLKIHDGLLKASRLDHFVFPLGPKLTKNIKKKSHISDEQIIEMLLEKNCIVKRVVHGDMARHFYYWASDNQARNKALDIAYKLKGSYAPEKRENKNLNFSLSELAELMDK